MTCWYAVVQVRKMSHLSKSSVLAAFSGRGAELAVPDDISPLHRATDDVDFSLGDSSRLTCWVQARITPVDTI